MTMQDSLYLEKAAESVAGAESEFGNRRYNNCANRAYYGCFQAAIAALERAGIRPTGVTGYWGHDFVQAQFAGQLINRRKLYPSTLRETLERTYKVREAADYRRDHTSRTQAERALNRANEFVTAILRGGEQP